MIIRSSILILLTLLAGSLNAQSVSGKVYNQWNWPDIVPLANAQVEMSDGTNTLTAITDNEGNYTIDFPTGIEDATGITALSGIKFYGNNYTLFTNGTDENTSVTISDILGKTKTIEAANKSINLSGYSNGFYSVTLKSEKEIYNRGIILLNGNIYPTKKYTYTLRNAPKIKGRLNKTNETKILNVKITSPEIWERETKIKTTGDVATQNFDVLTKTDFPDSLMNFYNLLAARSITVPPEYQFSRRIINPLTIYIKADTTIASEKHFYELIKNKLTQPLASRPENTYFNDAYKTPLYPEGFWKDIADLIEVGTNPPAYLTPGYFIIKQEDIGDSYVALSSYRFDFDTGIIYYAQTRWNILLNDTTINDMIRDEAIVKEMAMEFGRNNTQYSMWNSHANNGSKDFQLETDRKMNRFMFSRPPRSVVPDKDNGWDYELKKPLEQ